jgi:hypothetical protein
LAVANEITGCVRAPTTNYGVRNPGLMQSHDGTGTCNDVGTVQNPCPASTIVQMIRDGVAGTASGDGLVQTFKQAPGSRAAAYYGAARIYNSGSIAPSGDLGEGIATKCYSSDVANRLLGWVYATKACPLDGGPSVPALPPGSSPPGISHATVAVPVPSAQPISVPSTKTIIKTPSPATLNVKSAPGVTTNCAQYYQIQSGDFCLKVSERFNISFNTFRILNTGIDASCSNLWLGYEYCVKGL